MPENDPIRSIRLAPEVIADLTDLISSREELAAVVTAAESVPPAGSVLGFASRVAKSSDIDATVTLNVLRTLVNIRRMQRARDVDTARMVEILTASLQRYAPADWQSKHVEGWKETCPKIVDALGSIDQDHPLHVSEKAETLAYSHQNIVASQRIMTDVRPVFDKDANTIRETIVLHTLLVEYYDGISSASRIALTLDSGDIRELRGLCERAERKAHTVLDALQDFNPIELPEDVQGRNEP